MRHRNVGLCDEVIRVGLIFGRDGTLYYNYRHTTSGGHSDDGLLSYRCGVLGVICVSCSHIYIYRNCWEWRMWHEVVIICDHIYSTIPNIYMFNTLD